MERLADLAAGARGAATSGADGRAAAASVPPGARAAAASAEPLAWTRVAIAIVAAGYAIVAADGIARGTPGTSTELGAAIVVAVAFGLSFSRPRLASAVTLAAVWGEISASLLASPLPRSSAVLVYPGLATAAGLLVGGRAAALVAAANVAILIADATLDAAWGGTPYGDHAHWVLVACLVTVGSAAMASTVRRSYTALLARSEDARRRYAELFADVPDGLVAIGPDGRVVAANPAAGRLLGADPDALRGAPALDALRRAGAPADVDLSGAARPEAPLLVPLAPGGSPPRAVEISARAAAAGPGNGTPALLVLRDVTQRRAIEERLGHAQRLESLGQLAGSVAHDFNNLLTAIGSNASFLGDTADPEAREVAAEIVDGCRRGTALTRQLLAFARRDAHRPEPLDLAEVVRGTSRLLERVLGPRHRLDLRAGPARIVADRGQLEQVALNLVANARDAMPGGGTVSVSVRALPADAARALGSALAAPRQALLEVEDGGAGMTPEVQARIFEPFFTTKPRGEGTGLGLATVHGIAAQSGGHVVVDSAPGRGTRMRVFLPMREATA